MTIHKNTSQTLKPQFLNPKKLIAFYITFIALFSISAVSEELLSLNQNQIHQIPSSFDSVDVFWKSISTRALLFLKFRYNSFTCCDMVKSSKRRFKIS